MCWKCGNEKGFTLVEVLVAVTILTIGIAALIAVINTTAQLQMDTEQQVAATNAARRLMETIKSNSVDDIVSNYTGYLEENLNGFAEEDDSSATATVDIIETEDDGTPKVIEAVVMIQWRSGIIDGTPAYQTYTVSRRMSVGE